VVEQRQRRRVGQRQAGGSQLGGELVGLGLDLREEGAVGQAVAGSRYLVGSSVVVCAPIR